MKFNRTHIFLIIFISTFTVHLFSGRSIVLKELINPRAILADGEYVYITDQYSLFIYSLTKGKMILHVGNKGSGPAEFLFTPDVQLLDKGFLLYTSNRFAIFNLDGKLITQKNLTFPVFKIHQSCENYVTHQWMFQKNKRFSEMIIYDKDLNNITSIFKNEKKNKSLEQTIKSTRIIEPIITFKCGEGKIVLANGNRGFYFKILDSLGNHLNTIMLEMKKIPVKDEDKPYFIEIFKNKTFLKNKWRMFKQIAGDLDSLFPEYYPAYEDFFIDNHRLYVKTYERKNNNVLFIILNLNGEKLKRVWLPFVEGSRCAIGKEKFFYLVEREDTQEWELFVEKIPDVE